MERVGEEWRVGRERGQNIQYSIFKWGEGEGKKDYSIFTVHGKGGGGGDGDAGGFGADEGGAIGGRVEVGDIGDGDGRVGSKAGFGIGGGHFFLQGGDGFAIGGQHAEKGQLDIAIAVDDFAISGEAPAEIIDANQEGIAGAQGGVGGAVEVLLGVDRRSGRDQ